MCGVTQRHRRGCGRARCPAPADGIVGGAVCDNAAVKFSGSPSSLSVAALAVAGGLAFGLAARWSALPDWLGLATWIVIPSALAIYVGLRFEFRAGLIWALVSVFVGIVILAVGNGDAVSEDFGGTAGEAWLYWLYAGTYILVAEMVFVSVVYALANGAIRGVRRLTT